MRIEHISDATLYLGDCLKIMPSIPDKSIDMILCDLPYGTTACKWDVIIPFEPLWEQYKRIIKDNGAIVLFSGQPFTSLLVMSNLKMFKYIWTWKKNFPTGIALSKYQPMRVIEDICVFAKGKTTFNKQMIDCSPSVKKRWGDGDVENAPSQFGNYSETMGFKNSKPIVRYKINPINFLDIKAVNHSMGTFHPTQKPVALMEYLIRTYTNEGETVLDNCMGSGTTGVACVNLGRKFIGIEIEEKYFNIACERITSSYKQPKYSRKKTLLSEE